MRSPHRRRGHASPSPVHWLGATLLAAVPMTLTLVPPCTPASDPPVDVAEVVPRVENVEPPKQEGPAEGSPTVKMITPLGSMDEGAGRPSSEPSRRRVAKDLSPPAHLDNELVERLKFLGYLDEPPPRAGDREVDQDFEKLKALGYIDPKTCSGDGDAGIPILKGPPPDEGTEE